MRNKKYLAFLAAAALTVGGCPGVVIAEEGTERLTGLAGEPADDVFSGSEETVEVLPEETLPVVVQESPGESRDNSSQEEPASASEETPAAVVAESTVPSETSMPESADPVETPAETGGIVPAETEPLQTEALTPAQTESPEAEPAQTESGETEPASSGTEPAQTESGETEPAQTESGETVPVETESAVPVQTETGEVPSEESESGETESDLAGKETESEGFTEVPLEMETDTDMVLDLVIETESESETGAEELVLTDPAVVIPGFEVDPSKYPPANISKNTTTIYWYLRDRLGLNHAAACGVLGNIQMESNFNPLALGDSGSSYGICQWHLGRFSSLISFCKGNGLDYNTVEGQLEYLAYEFRGLYSGTYQYLLSVPDTTQGAYDAAYYMCIHYESPNQMVARGQQRGNLAKNEYYVRSFGHDTVETPKEESQTPEYSGRVLDMYSAIALQAQERTKEEVRLLLIEVVETQKEEATEAETAAPEEPETEVAEVEVTEVSPAWEAINTASAGIAEHHVESMVDAALVRIEESGIEFTEEESVSDVVDGEEITVILEEIEGIYTNGNPAEASETEIPVEEPEAVLTHAMEPYSGVTTDELNVRENPDRDAAVIDLLVKDAEVTVLDDADEDGFVPVEYVSDEGKKSGYVHSDYLETEAHESVTEEQQTESEAAVPETAAVDEKENTPTETLDAGAGDLERAVNPCFFGDSRVVGMAQTTGYYSYIGKVSAGYDWMSKDGVGYLEEQMASRTGKDVVFCFGVNDLKHVQEYISFYKSFTEKHPELRIWFMSVNPVNEAVEIRKGYSVTNAEIEAFNEELRAAFPSQYIDTYSFLLAGGYSTGDGVHYGADTYAAIQNYTVASIQANL